MMNEEIKQLLEALLADIKVCKEGTRPTGATLYAMERRIKDALARMKEVVDAGR